PVEMSQLMRGCYETFRATGRMLDYTVNLDANPDCWVEGDATRLEQVISNLIDNALKYTPPGGRIELVTRVDGEDTVLTVRDTGVGIGAELLPHVFDVFVQGTSSIDRSQGGLGIGLSLVRRLVELHGGSVSALSDGAGTGSTFMIRLPRSAAPEKAAPEKNQAQDYNKPSVLLIEDNDDGREMMAMMLTTHGYPVRHAADGVQGVDLAAADVPDVALVDIGLPGIDGYEVARRLRSAQQTRNIRLIALTGYGQEEDHRRVMEAGFDVHLVKPVQMEALIDAISRLPAASAK
ncbi:MAG TPA: ATP-binding protein, partial [Telluria sp.]